MQYWYLAPLQSTIFLKQKAWRTQNRNNKKRENKTTKNVLQFHLSLYNAKAHLFPNFILKKFFFFFEFRNIFQSTFLAWQKSIRHIAKTTGTTQLWSERETADVILCMPPPLMFFSFPCLLLLLFLFFRILYRLYLSF